MPIQVEIAVGINCALGEGPVWDARQQCLRFVDILSAKIFSYHPGSGKLRTMEVPGMVGAMVPCKDGRFLAAMADGLYYVDVETEELAFLFHPESHLPDNRFNDGKCDAHGRFWIGSMHTEEEADSGALYVIDRELSCKKLLDGTTISNGLEWDEQQQWFYHIDSATKGVNRFVYDAHGGAISQPERIITFEDDEGVPDGMTMDTEGMLWIAHFGGGCVSRRDPKTGEVLLKIALPVKQVTSCAFGGERLSDLYITTAAKELSEAEMAEQPLAGCTFVVKDIGYTGYKPNEFG